MKCKILIDYGAAEGWKVGDVVEITNPDKLIYEGKVEEFTGKEVPAQPEEKEVKKEKSAHVCTVCGFVTNSGAGYKSHMRKHEA